MSGRILGIDYGIKRIGVALSDPLFITAQGLPTINYSFLSEALDQIRLLIQDYQIEKIVIGSPLSLKGEKSTFSTQTDKFIDRLKNEFHLPVIEIDERFTSLIANQTLKELGKKPSKNRRLKDMISAQLILQTYLNQQ